MALALLALTAFTASASAAPCPGATQCPYSSASIIGTQGQGTLRFPEAIARGYDGRIYVGDVFTHMVQIFNPDGSFQGEFGSGGTGPGQFGAVGGIAISKSGSVYVADSFDRIERFTLDGQYLGSWGSSGTGLGHFAFGAGGTHASPGGGGVSVSANHVFVADTRNDRIQRFDLDGNNPLIIGAGQLSKPQGVLAVANKIVVPDDDHHRLVFYSSDGAFLRELGKGPGNLPGQLNFPYDVATDARGNLYVADNLNHRIVRYGPPPAHAYRAFWGGFGSAVGKLEYPRALTADLAGNTYVTDTANDRIQMFTPSGLTLRPPFGLNGRGPGQFTVPLGIGIDASGIRAVADSIDGRVELFNPDGTLAGMWGAPSPGPTLLEQPVAVAFNAVGNGYVLDQGHDTVVVFNRAGTIIRKLGGPGLGPGLMQSPSAIALDAAGNIYVADTGNGRIVRFAADGTPMPSIGHFTEIEGIAVEPDGSRIYGADSATNRITVLDRAGAQITQYGGQGRKGGHFLTLGAIALDPAGHLWTTERGGNRVQQLDSTTGKGLASFGERGTNLGQLIHPDGIAVGCTGTVTVSDTGANRLQAFAPLAPSTVACAALPPVGTTPNIKLPTGPPDPPAELTFKLVRRNGVIKRGVVASARCDQACTLQLGGTLAPAGAPPRHRAQTVVRLQSVTRKLLAGTTTPINLTLSPLAVRTLNAALAGRQLLTLQLQGMARTLGAPPTLLTQTVKVTR